MSCVVSGSPKDYSATGAAHEVSCDITQLVECQNSNLNVVGSIPTIIKKQSLLRFTMKIV